MLIQRKIIKLLNNSDREGHIETIWSQHSSQHKYVMHAALENNRNVYLF